MIDCGAGIGLFSLLIEHMRRLGILRWESVSYVAIEPSKYNFDRMKQNISSNIDDGLYEIVEGLVGQRSGESDFFQSPWRRWSASVFQRIHFLERKVRRQYIDISPFLRDVPCLLKVDIEGAEFTFLDTYQAQLANCKALIVEWHAECGDVDHSDSVLVSLGFETVARRNNEPNRIVDFYMRNSA